MAAQAHNDWNERIALAQQMLPLLGQLHRNNNGSDLGFRTLAGECE